MCYTIWCKKVNLSLWSKAKETTERCMRDNYIKIKKKVVYFNKIFPFPNAHIPHYFYYYYVTPNSIGWRVAILRFFFTIIILILPHIFVCSNFRRCLDQTLWNLVGISYTMWNCPLKGWFFQNGCHCHGNDQNAKKLKNTKMIIASYSPNRNWWNLIGIGRTNFAAVAMETKKGGFKIFWIPFNKLHETL
jgi:hypothetical protein